MKCMENLKVMRVSDYSEDSVVEDGAVNVESVTVDSSSDTSFGSARMRPGAHTHPKVGVGGRAGGGKGRGRERGRETGRGRGRGRASRRRIEDLSK